MACVCLQICPSPPRRKAVVFGVCIRAAAAAAGEFFDSPAPAAAVLSWAIRSASGVPGSAAGRRSHVPHRHEREPTTTVKGIRFQFQQEASCLTFIPTTHRLFFSFSPALDVTCFNTASLRERTEFQNVHICFFFFFVCWCCRNVRNQVGP